MNYALITGGSSGIGLCYAKQLAQQGHNILIVSNQSQQGGQVAEQLQAEYGVEAMALYADLTEQDAAEQIYNFCHERGIEVDILINNAGMLLFSQMTKTSEQQLQRIVALHCTTPTMLCRLFGRNMCERGSGHILLMSSITAWTPYPTISHYAATKAYLRSFAQSLWYELRGTGVSLTTVFPSAVDTPFYDLKAEHRRWLLRLGLMLSAEEVARKALRAMFRGRRRSLPGGWTKVEAALCVCLPAWALLPVLKLPAVRRILERV